ncbi:aldo/keto reductase [Asanoa iriomotensis]|nr:aldo/keto reductase [Asanoa iriomotensis]
MNYRRLGSSGLVVSVAGVGCNTFGREIDESAAHAVVDSALELGINFFDTSDTYGGAGHELSERFLGTALKGRRDDVVVATKFGKPMSGVNGPDLGARGARRYVLRAVEGSLRRLNTDHIDLYQMHEPDPATPIEETLSALDDLVTAGKVRYIGCSNFAAWQVADAAWVSRTRGWAPFISVQNHYSLLNRGIEAELVPACERFGLGVLPFFPLESGLLTGKYRQGESARSGTRLHKERFAHHLRDAPWSRIEALQAYASARGLSLLDVALGGLAAMPAVASVISGATTPDQVRENAAAVAWQPSAADLAELRALE